jgi:hypothetical protein
VNTSSTAALPAGLEPPRTRILFSHEARCNAAQDIEASGGFNL